MHAFLMYGNDHNETSLHQTFSPVREKTAHTDAIVMFSDQNPNFFILLGPKEASWGCARNLFDRCHLRHFSDSLRFNRDLLELCEKVPRKTSGQDQKDYTEACAIKEACREIISTEKIFKMMYFSRKSEYFKNFVQGCVCKRVHKS